ncbi:MAG: hypothetical protein JWM68_3850 [Verrucomicrobiales bacterium]|nr:hypothetical protein [Verrucomicrobiales bacterium]
MSEQDQSYRKAWNPLTFRGVAKFASSKLPRLLLIEFLFSLIIFSTVVWFIAKNYAPIIVKTIEQLPDTGRLENRTLKGIESRIESEGKFLSLTIETNDLADTGTGDLQVGFGETNIFVCSVVSSSWGCLTFDYPPDTLDLNRSSVQPWWGARQPIIIGTVGVCFIVIVFAGLALIAIALMWLPKFVAYFADRKLTLLEAWKLSVAAQFPGIIVLGAAVILYGSQSMDLLSIGVFYAMHIVVDLVYLIGAVFFLPRIATKVANPFGSSEKRK